MALVKDVAAQLGVPSEAVLDHLRKIGLPVAGEEAVLEDWLEQRVRTDLGNGRAAGVGAGPTTQNEAVPERKRFSLRRKPKKPKAKHSWTKQIAEIPVLVLFAFLIAVIIKTFVAQAFFIPSASMLPQLRHGDRVLVEKIGYRFGDPSRGDVVVFARSNGAASPDVPWYEDGRNFLRELLGLPTGAEEDYIKRIVAVGGDTISYTGAPRVLRVNGEVVEEPYIKGGRDRGSQAISDHNCRQMKLEPTGRDCLVPAGTVFVMGDNRANSSDSRVIGPVDADKIVGRAVAVIWPPKDFGGL